MSGRGDVRIGRSPIKRGVGGCAGLSGEVWRMQESYDKGVANHVDPELCVAGRKAGCEA